MYHLGSCILLMVFGTIHNAAAVYHGLQAERGQFKYMAHITDNKVYCSGGIIDPYHILTAAHCVACSNPKEAKVIVDKAHTMDDGQHCAVQAFHFHKDYEQPSRSMCRTGLKRNFECLLRPFLRRSEVEMPRKHDIAVITLQHSIIFDIHVKSLRLPENNWLPECLMLKFAGFGDSEFNSLSLRYYALSLFPTAWLPGLGIDAQEREFYGGDTRREAYASFGDSGSPLVYKNVVYGVTTQSSCEDGGMLIFLKTYDYLEFIKDAMADVPPTI